MDSCKSTDALLLYCTVWYPTNLAAHMVVMRFTKNVLIKMI